ncbi:MAG: hypothetical protein N2035_09795 [Chthoniobacterales bacterium]|nr:hypothetical protein [Chthoniobacterales bacterium]MCX7713933.1 hypothetical protein [Chthoniobacterales bacterium]
MKTPSIKSALILFLTCAASYAQSWTILNLPNTVSWNTISLTHLPDGRFIYSHDGSIFLQNSFGSNATTSFTNAPSGDYAFITTSFVAAGAWGAAPIYSYNSSNTSTTFTNLGSRQNYAGVNYGSGLLLVGNNGNNNTSSLAYFTSGNNLQTIIDNISTYSGGIALDANGDVYLADDDDLLLYRFTNTQITNAISNNTTLTLSQGTLLGNLGVSASIAVDIANNRLYAAGYQINGIRVLDFSTNQTGTLIPGPNNANYQVSFFSDGTNTYLGWLNRSGYSGGDTVLYGYALASTIPIPEPSTASIALLATLALLRTLNSRNSHKSKKAKI